jgi:hypothetical protein
MLAKVNGINDDTHGNGHVESPASSSMGTSGVEYEKALVEGFETRWSTDNGEGSQ